MADTPSDWAAAGVAEAWQRAAETRNRMLAPATETMFELAHVRAAARVLDIGTGTGDTAILASRRLAPTGHIVATDSSPSMIQAASDAVRQAHAANVIVRLMSAEGIDVEEASFDAVIARLVLMFVRNLPGVLSGILRALRPGGRFAGVVWASLERNPYHRILIESARAYGPLPDPEPEMVRAFSLHDPAALARALTRAGFHDVGVCAVPCVREYASASEALASAKESPILSAVFSALDGPLRTHAWERVEKEYAALDRNGACVFQGELLVASGGRASS
jgi:ubiquinone/menaquinone biosynthesis C-methylase UbiE